jgi:transposase InsO family protein
MSRKGNCWDNAVAESFFKTLKTEWVNKRRYRDVNDARKSIFDYIERWYNTQRNHSAIGYKTPLQMYLLLNNRSVALGSNVHFCEDVH